MEELEAAQETAKLAGIQQALDKGMISQNQDDLMTARIKLGNYIDRDSLLAQALGLSVEELQAARDEGKTMFQLMTESELDPATVRTAMTDAYQEAVQQAVADGVITQDQADTVLSLPGFGFGGPRNFGGFHGRGGPGGFSGRGGPGGFGWR